MDNAGMDEDRGDETERLVRHRRNLETTESTHFL
jgi:hypothetical protein